MWPHKNCQDFRMLITVLTCGSKTFSKGRCENDQECVTHKQSKLWVGSIKDDRFNVTFIFLNVFKCQSETAIITWKQSRYFSGFHALFYFFFCLFSSITNISSSALYKNLFSWWISLIHYSRSLMIKVLIFFFCLMDQIIWHFWTTFY